MNRVLSRLMLITGMVILFTGCMSYNFDKNLPVIETDIESCELAAQVVEGQDMIAGAFRVKSNQSWSAQVIYQEGNELDWLNLLQTEYENLSGKIEEAMVTFVLGRNRVDTPREAMVRLVSQDCEAIVKVIQRAAQLYVELDLDQQVNVDCTAGSSVLNIQSNTAWTVAIKDGATANVSIDVTTGSDDGVVNVSFAENFDADNTKTATIVVTTAGGITKEVTFIQSVAIPYVKVDPAQSLDMAPDATEATIKLLANKSWTASLKDVSRWNDFKLNTTSGGVESPALSINFPQSYTPEVKEAVIALTLDSGESTDVKITQKGMVMVVDFKQQPFTEEIGKFVKNNPNDFFGVYSFPWSGANYDFLFPEGTDASKKSEAAYIAFDEKSQDITGAVYVSYTGINLPAIPELSLGEVTVIACATSKKWLISENGTTTAVSGGEIVTLDKGSTHTWVLKEPKLNHSYSLTTTTSAGRIKSIKLIYR